MNNLANSGGACYLYDSISSITNSKFINNNATGSEFNYGGAGIYLDSSESSLVDNCTFINNTAINGGAMHCHLSFPTINNSFFDNNKAENGGLVIFIVL
ncbi:MAG: hypothetical protein MJ209_03095 [archaeon]|nr:hypothetical protein [archaeon]